MPYSRSPSPGLSLPPSGQGSDATTATTGQSEDVYCYWRVRGDLLFAEGQIAATKRGDPRAKSRNLTCSDVLTSMLEILTTHARENRSAQEDPDYAGFRQYPALKSIEESTAADTAKKMLESQAKEIDDVKEELTEIIDDLRRAKEGNETN